jgi:hypothetical protein
MHIIYLYESRDKPLFLHFDSHSDSTSFDTSFSGGRIRSTGMHPFCNLQSQARTHAVLVVIGLYELLGHLPSSLSHPGSDSDTIIILTL